MVSLYSAAEKDSSVRLARLDFFFLFFLSVFFLKKKKNGGREIAPLTSEKVSVTNNLA